MTKQEYIQTQLEQAGIARFAPVSQEGIEYDAVFRDVCAQNTCGRYGTCYMCPPDVGPIDELIQRAKQYPMGILYQTIHEIEDSFDIEGMFEAKKAHSSCSIKLQELLPEGCLHMGAGGCGVCERCAKLDGVPCRFPGKALPSLEAYGVNVYKTACNAGLKYVNGENTITYFGIVLFSEERNA